MKMTKAYAAAALLLLSFSAVQAKAPRKASFDYTVADELRKLVEVSDLPAYRTGVVEQISSYDPTGGNEDGFAGKYSFLREEDGKLVLADLQGPGVVNRIWTPTPTSDTLEFYFDGEAEARLRICFRDLFSGKVEPFVRPLCANEVGGYYCYFPFTYAKSLKICFTGKMIQFHQIQYRSLEGRNVESFRNELNDEEKSLVKDICRKWGNLSPVIDQVCEGYETHEESFTIAPGELHSFFTDSDGGRIAGFELEAGTAFEGQFRDLVLKARWDEDTDYAINAPVADFFGYGFGKPAMRGFLIGSALGRNYAYLPAPYDSRAELALKYEIRDGERQEPVRITAKVYYKNQAREAGKEGRLYTCWRREKPCTKGQFHTFLKHEGKGHYIGTIHLAQGLEPKMTEFFEGDDSTYVDGKMRMHGTGSEDYYNGGWYALVDRWDRGSSMPLHGCIDYSLQNSRTGGYRFYLNDKMSFEDEIYIGIEHGPTGNAWPADYTSIAFYYGETPATCQMEPTAELREIWYPDIHPFFPQAMPITLGNHVKTQFIYSGIRCWAEGEGVVRVLLTDIPEGRYKVFMNYCQKPDGAEYSVWQRQRMIHDWDSTRGEHKWVDHYYLGEMELTSQSNSVSFHFKGENYSKELEFAIIYLEKKEENFGNAVIPFNWPDPTIWQADGKFYTVATGINTILESTNLVNWKNMRRRPLTEEAAQSVRSLSKKVWAPDMVRIGDKWMLYLTLYGTGAEDSRIGAFSSDSPTGPWKFESVITDSKDTGIKDTIDPEVVADPATGKLWLFFGSIGKVHRVELDRTGTALAKKAKYVHVAGVDGDSDHSREKVFEGSYLHQHDGWWYLFASKGQYWSHTYGIVVGRSRTLDGVFLDREGRPMTEGYGTLILGSDKGDRFYGPGHNGEIFTDATGQDYMLFHCHDKKAESSGVRHTLLQRIFWGEDGWPYFDGGKVAETELAPVF
ncbi:MAG: DUF2961 domain-containing protein [Bacteroidales bacterium]|nr:DUF2961 domain-containing protein [Bacteroidales bacterium]